MRQRLGNALIVILLAAAAWSLLAACGRPALGTPGRPIVLQFAPSAAGPQAEAARAQLSVLLRSRTGLEVEVSLASSYAAVREAMAAGRVHMGWLDTFNYLLAHERDEVDIALVGTRLGASSCRGQVIVGAGSGIATLAGLRGARVCWVSADSPAGYIVPRAMLMANGLHPAADLADSIFCGSDEAVVRAVYRGECDAGATLSDARSAVERDLPDVREKVLVLATTTDILFDGLSVAPGVPQEARERMVAALLEVAADDEGRAILGALGSVDGLQRVEDSFYDLLRADLGQAGIDLASLIGGP